VTCLLFPVLSQLAVAGDGGQIIVEIKVGEKNNVWCFFCGLDAKKSEVEKSRQVLIIRIGSRNWDDNPVSPDLTSFHSLSLAIL